MIETPNPRLALPSVTPEGREVGAPDGKTGVVQAMTISTRMRSSVLAVASLLAVACGRNTSPDGVICTAEARAAISLIVVDSLAPNTTGFTGVWARAVDGAYRDSSTMTFVEPGTGTTRLALAYERQGTYTVTVHADGYQDWTKAGIVVTGDQCHVTGALLTAKLVK